MSENVQKKLYDDKELIPLAMIEQFAVHHLGGDTELAQRIARESLLDKSKNVE